MKTFLTPFRVTHASGLRQGQSIRVIHGLHEGNVGLVVRVDKSSVQFREDDTGTAVSDKFIFEFTFH